MDQVLTEQEPSKVASLPPGRVLVVVPAYDEADSLPGVIADLRGNAVGADIVVVNDGSNDDTSKVARELGVMVLDLPYNLGIGGAVQTGFKLALRNGYDVAVQVDGDGQHPASHVAAICEPVLRGEADMVIGSRFVRDRGYEGSASRRTGIAMLSWVCSRISGVPVTDATSGFRAYSRRALRFFAECYPTDYPEPESIVLLAKRKMRVREVSVPMRERQGGVSSIRGFRPVYYMVKVTLALLVDMFRENPRRGL